MEKDLIGLLRVSEADISGLLEEYKPQTTCCTNIPINFFYIRFQDGLPRTHSFVNKLCDNIIHFCLKREKQRSLDTGTARKLYLEAKRKFSQPSNGKTGEPGELILFFLLEGHLRAPKIFTKMNLKTNSQMHVHGADGVHLGLEGSDVVLYFGESKLYQDCRSGIKDALDSVKEFVSPTSTNSNYMQIDFEIDVITDHIDLPDGQLRNKVLQVLDPYSIERSRLKYVHTCFIGFDILELNSTCDAKDFDKLYESTVQTSYKTISTTIKNDPVLNKQRWRFYFIPFQSVQSFRRSFIDELNA